MTVRLIPCAALLALAACSDSAMRKPPVRIAGGVTDSAPAAEGVKTGISVSEARFVRNLVGFQGPESVRYDPEQDVFFISNMAGYGSAKDGNGYISRVSAANPDSAQVFVQGGKNGVTLDSPKGMAIHGDTLWVADINILRGFDRHTGAPLANIDFTSFGVLQLNDVAVGPDGTVRVTDTGIIMGRLGVQHVGTDHIFVLGPGGKVSAPQQGPELHQPNGITWDSAGKRWIVLSFDRLQGQVAELPLDMKTRKVIFQSQVVTQLDGVEMLPDHSIMFTSWADSSIHVLDGTTEKKIIRGVPVPADIGVDTRRHRLAIPLSMLGRVQLWDIAAIGSP
jgi:sugar lactone lactonase YvrE